MERTFDLHNFFKQQRDAERRFRYAKPVEPHKAFARFVENKVMYRIAERGHTAVRQKRNARFDILVDDCLRVEVKASKWYESQSGGRYQANIHNRCDLIVFVCVNGTHHHFIIPQFKIGSRSNIAVWSYEPRDYAGQWATYLEAWPVLENAVQTARQRPYQLSFNHLVTDCGQAAEASVTNTERR